MERITLAQVHNSERFFRVPKQLFESDFYKKCQQKQNYYMLF